MRLLFTVLLAIPLSATAGNIYRCDADGVIVFSDAACAEDAELHVSTGNLSISGLSAGEVERLTEQNRQFIEVRLDHLAEQRADAGRAREPATAPVQIIQARPLVIPVRDKTRRPGPPARQDGERASGQERDERFSALSGRQPGARRRSH